MAPMPKASANVPRFFEPLTSNLLWSFEKSMAITSNMARPRSTKRIAIPTLNQIVLLMAPKVAAVRVTISPRPP